MPPQGTVRATGWRRATDDGHGDLILGGRGFEFLELQLHLIDQAGTSLQAVAILFPPQPGDLELQMLDHRLGGRDHRPGLRQFALGGLGTGLRGRERGAQSGDLGSRIRHGRDLPRRHRKAHERRLMRPIYPAFAGHCVQRGLRQSIPSRRYPSWAAEICTASPVPLAGQMNFLASRRLV